MTLCTDSSEEIRKDRGKHGAKAIMLSDADLKVTTLYNLVNGNLGITPKGTSAMPIPTTILVDAEGKVRWIDQSTDYQVRSNKVRVLAALERELGTP